MDGLMTLEELYKKMNDTEAHNFEEFSERFEIFKEWMISKYPNYTIDEIIYIHNNRNKINEIYSWFDADKFMKCLELQKLNGEL